MTPEKETITPRDLELKEYMDINDFEAGLRHKAIYTDEVIIGWIRDTFKYAWGCGAKSTNPNTITLPKDVVEGLAAIVDMSIKSLCCCHQLPDQGTVLQCKPCRTLQAYEAALKEAGE